MIDQQLVRHVRGAGDPAWPAGSGSECLRHPLCLLSKYIMYDGGETSCSQLTRRAERSREGPYKDEVWSAIGDSCDHWGRRRDTKRTAGSECSARVAQWRREHFVKRARRRLSEARGSYRPQLRRLRQLTVPCSAIAAQFERETGDSATSGPPRA